ncbi:MAG: hypothetical protein V4850_10705 [Myxococcota bacterium]
MDKTTLTKLQGAIAQVTDKPQYFAFIPAASIGGAKPEPLLLISKLAQLKPSNVVAQAKTLLGVTLANGAKPIYSGTVRKGKVVFLFATDAATSAPPLDMGKAAKQIRQFATTASLARLKGSVITLGEPDAAAIAEGEGAEKDPTQQPRDTTVDASGEDEAEEEGASEQADTFAARLRKLKAEISGSLNAEVKQKAGLLTLAVRSQDFAAANKTLDEIEALLAGPAGASAGEAALAEWQRSRAQVVKSLNVVAQDIAKARHASSAKAIMEIKAVLANLTAAPTTERQVEELETWLANDEVVADICDLADDFRAPLLKALAELRPHVG